MKKILAVAGVLLAALAAFGAYRLFDLHQRREAAHVAFQAKMAAWPGARTVVPFAFKAPNARQVFLAGEMTDWDHEKIAMVRGEDGVWRASVALPPGQWVYKFVVNGEWVADPANPLSDKDGQGGRHSYLLLGEGDWIVPAGAPHGVVKTFNSPAGTLTNVYLPPGYAAGKSYPLLVLLHGSGADADQWYRTGMVDRFMDRMIARGAVQPFIIVMPSVGHGYGGENETAIIGQLLPLLKKDYGVSLKTGETAISGMSMGGLGAFYLAYQHPDIFGLSIPVSGVYRAPYLASLQRPVRLPFQLEILCGSSDFLIDDNRALQRLLKTDGVAFNYQESNGGHEWHYWNAQLPFILSRASRFFQSRQ